MSRRWDLAPINRPEIVVSPLFSLVAALLRGGVRIRHSAPAAGRRLLQQSGQSTVDLRVRGLRPDLRVEAIAPAASEARVREREAQVQLRDMLVRVSAQVARRRAQEEATRRPLRSISG